MEFFYFIYDIDDSGCIDNIESKDRITNYSGNDSDFDLGTSSIGELNRKNHHEQRNCMLTTCTGIDESNPSEV